MLRENGKNFMCHDCNFKNFTHIYIYINYVYKSLMINRNYSLYEYTHKYRKSWFVLLSYSTLLAFCL